MGGLWLSQNLRGLLRVLKQLYLHGQQFKLPLLHVILSLGSHNFFHSRYVEILNIYELGFF